MTSELSGGSAWSHLWEIFHEVRAADTASRGALLDRLCGVDAALRREVEQLLEADEVPTSPLDRSPLVRIASDSPVASVTVQPGMILCDRFEMIRRIGQGGMGSVYEAVDRSLGGRVAVKTLLPSIAAEERARRRFYREIDLARQVTHPNVCRLFDLFEHKDTASGQDIVFVTMELLDGETLSARLRRERLSTDEALEIARQIAAALDAAHACGIVHRDLKPGNVLLTGEGGVGRVVVTDFGLALRPADSSPGARLTGAGQLFGTPDYMAPEQLLDGEISPATDIYAFGVLLYEMITGSLPFQSESALSAMIKRLHTPAPSPRTITPTIDRAWEHTIARCLEGDPRERFQSASEVIASLSGERPTSRPRMLRWVSRRRAIFAALAAVMIAVVVVAIILRLRPQGVGARPDMSVIRLTNSGNVMAAALSNDGKFVAYALNEGGLHSLWVKQVATGAAARIAAPSRIWYRSLSVSPDSNYVYAMAGSPSGGGLYQVPILGGEPRRVLTHNGPPEFSLSPDGSRVALRTTARGGEFELITVNIPDGSRQVVLRRPPTNSLFLPAWSPDGSKIAFGSTVLSPTIERRIEEVTLATGRTRTIQRIDWPYIASINWMADGKHLLVAAYENEQPPQVWLVPANGGESLKVTNDVSAFYSAIPTQDSKTFAALRGEGSGSLSILRALPDGRAEIVRSRIGNYFVLAGARVSSSIPTLLQRGGLRWAGSDRIVFTGAAGGRRVLMVMPRDGGEPRTLTEQQTAWSPETSVDGRTVAFISDRSPSHQVWASAIDGGNARQLTFGGYVHTLAGSTIDHVYYITGTGPHQGLWRVAFSGGAPHTVESGWTGRVAVAPDGRAILHSSNAGLVLKPLDDRAARAFAVPRYGRTVIARFDPGGRSFSFVDWKDGVANIWRQNVDGGEPKQTTNLTRGEIYAFDWSPDGTFLAIAHGEPVTDVVLLRNFR